MLISLRPPFPVDDLVWSPLIFAFVFDIESASVTVLPIIEFTHDCAHRVEHKLVTIDDPLGCLLYVSALRLDTQYFLL